MHMLYECRMICVQETVRSWRLLIACVVDELRYGFERESRKLRRGSHNSDDSRRGSQPSSNVNSRRGSLLTLSPAPDVNLLRLQQLQVSAIDRAHSVSPRM